MPTLTRNIDEVTYQQFFYKSLLGDSWLDWIKLDINTDGYMNGLIFEHKRNITSYGKSKPLSQALIFLSRFNLNGIPVPKYTILVSQEENKVFIYNNNNDRGFINNTVQYASLKHSNHARDEPGVRLCSFPSMSDSLADSGSVLFSLVLA